MFGELDDWTMNLDQRSSKSLKVFFQKDVLKSFAKLTGKHQFRSLFFNDVADLNWHQLQ